MVSSLTQDNCWHVKTNSKFKQHVIYFMIQGFELNQRSKLFCRI